MIVNVYYIAFELEEVEKNYRLFKYVYKKSHGVGIQLQKNGLIYVACTTKEKRSQDFVLWKKYFNTPMLVFKEGVINSSCLGEEGKLKGE